MLLRDIKSGILPRMLTAAAMAAVLVLSGCQVRPLYSAGPVTVDGSPSASNLSVSVDEVTTRYAQEVRNHLIFMLNGGAGEPASAAYKLDLGITKRVISSADVQVNGEGQPTAGAVVLSSNYILQDTTSGETISAGKRTITSSFDRSRQQFAQLRAEREAEDRAARELAEVLHLVIAGELAKR